MSKTNECPRCGMEEWPCQCAVGKTAIPAIDPVLGFTCQACNEEENINDRGAYVLGLCRKCLKWIGEQRKKKYEHIDHTTPRSY